MVYRGNYNVVVALAIVIELCVACSSSPTSIDTPRQVSENPQPSDGDNNPPDQSTNLVPAQASASDLTFLESPPAVLWSHTVKGLVDNQSNPLEPFVIDTTEDPPVLHIAALLTEEGPQDLSQAFEIREIHLYYNSFPIGETIRLEDAPNPGNGIRIVGEHHLQGIVEFSSADPQLNATIQAEYNGTEEEILIRVKVTDFPAPLNQFYELEYTLVLTY